MSLKQPTRLFDIPQYQLQLKDLPDCLTTKIDGKWVPMSTSTFLQEADKVSRALIELGVQHQEKIALISSTNRFEWNVMDIGILQTGAVNVPVYPTITSEDYDYIFNDAEVTYCVVSDRALYDKVIKIKANVPSLKEIYIFDEEEGIKNWSELLALGVDKKNDEELEKRKTAVKPEELATLIYTSGTTGRPKGVMLSHHNLVSNVLDSCPRIPIVKGGKALSFLPICHVFERMLTYLYMYNAFPIYFAESIEKIGDNIREVKPEIFAAVPRLLEKVYDKIIAKGNEQTGIKKALFFWAVDLANQYNPATNGAFYNFKLGIARKLIFSKWQEALGGNVRAIVSGGAALNPKLKAIFSAAGFNVQEGYGLTETSPVIAVNVPGGKSEEVGTVGAPIQNVQVKIAEDGEILCKGPNVMMGYYKQPEKTAEVLEADGWFHTGDIGEMVNNGKYLKITDRKKEIFKTSGGKYVAPQIIENKLKESRFIEQTMVIGEGEKHPAAFVQPDFVFLKAWAEKKGIAAGDNKTLIDNVQVQDRIMEEVEEVNETLGKSEQVKKIALTADIWSVDGGHLTPKMSLIRRNIKDMYKAEYQEIYGHGME